MSNEAQASFSYEDDPDQPGWKQWRFRDPTRYNAFVEPLLIRTEGDVVRVRMQPERRHSNLQDRLHGGALLGFVDVALFAAAGAFGLIDAGTAVTLDLSVQFIGGGAIGVPLDAEIELLRETGRLLFLRGLVVQREGERIAGFAGTIRKPTRRADRS